MRVGAAPAEVPGEQRPQAPEVVARRRGGGPAGEAGDQAPGGADGRRQVAAVDPAAGRAARRVGLGVVVRRRLRRRRTQAAEDRQRQGAAAAQDRLDVERGGLPEAPDPQGGEGQPQVDEGAAAAPAGAGAERADGVQPAVAGQLGAALQQGEQRVGAAPGRGQRAARAEGGEGHAQRPQVAAQRQAVGLGVARHDADPLRPRPGVEQRPHPQGHLAGFAVRAHGGEALHPGRRRCRGRRGGLAHRSGQPLAEAGREGLLLPGRGAGRRRRRVGRHVEDQARRQLAQQGLEEIGGDAGGVGEAVDPQRPGGQRPLRVEGEPGGGTAQQVGAPVDAEILDLGDHPFRHPHQGGAERHLVAGRARGAVRPQRRERLFRSVGVDRLEPGVEQVADAGRHRRVAVDEGVEPPGHRRLVAGGAPRQQLEDDVTPRPRRLAAALEDLVGHRLQRLDAQADGGAAAAADDLGGEVVPQADRGDHHPQGAVEAGGRRPPQGGLELPEEGVLGGAGAAGDEHPRGAAVGGGGGGLHRPPMLPPPGGPQAPPGAVSQVVGSGAGAPAAGSAARGADARHRRRIQPATASKARLIEGSRIGVSRAEESRPPITVRASG